MGLLRQLLAMMRIRAMSTIQLVELLPTLMEQGSLANGSHQLQRAAEARFQTLSFQEQRDTLIVSLTHREGRIRLFASERLMFWQNSPSTTMVMADALSDSLSGVRFCAALHIVSCGRVKDRKQLCLVLDKLRTAKRRERDDEILEKLD
jgi:hypothetical protein